MKLLVAFVSLCVLLPFGASAGEWFDLADDWDLRRERDGIEVYTAPVEDSGFNAFRAVTELCVDVPELVALIHDVDSFPEWLADTEEAELLERTDEWQRHHVVSDTPWPLDSRDMVYEIQVLDDPDADPVRVAVTGLPDAEPRAEGAVRLDRARGGWRLRPRNGRTEVEFEMHVEPGGPVPAWLANIGLVDNPFETFAALRERYPCSEGE